MSSNYMPNNSEEAYNFEQLWLLVNPSKTPSIGGKTAVEFFRKTEVDGALLKKIWSLSTSAATMDKGQFFTAMRFVAMVQHAGTGAERSSFLSREKLSELASTPLPPPTLNDTAFVPSQSYGMTDEQFAKYRQLFIKYDSNGDGMLQGSEAAPILAKSGLDKATLRHIWALSDMDRDGKLSPVEFAVAFHLIVAVTKKGLLCPPVLPPSLLLFSQQKNAAATATALQSPAPAPAPAPVIVAPQAQSPALSLHATTAAPSVPLVALSPNAMSRVPQVLQSPPPASQSPLPALPSPTAHHSPRVMPAVAPPAGPTITSSNNNSSNNLSAGNAPGTGGGNEVEDDDDFASAEFVSHSASATDMAADGAGNTNSSSGSFAVSASANKISSAFDDLLGDVVEDTPAPALPAFGSMGSMGSLGGPSAAAEPAVAPSAGAAGGGGGGDEWDEFVTTDAPAVPVEPTAAVVAAGGEDEDFDDFASAPAPAPATAPAPDAAATAAASASASTTTTADPFGDLGVEGGIEDAPLPPLEVPSAGALAASAASASASASAVTADAEGNDEADDFGDFTASPQPTAAVESQEEDDFGDFTASPQRTAAVESQEGDDFGDFAASPPPQQPSLEQPAVAAAEAGSDDPFASIEPEPQEQEQGVAAALSAEGEGAGEGAVVGDGDDEDEALKQAIALSLQQQEEEAEQKAPEAEVEPQPVAAPEPEPAPEPEVDPFADLVGEEDSSQYAPPEGASLFMSAPAHTLPSATAAVGAGAGAAEAGVPAADRGALIDNILSIMTPSPAVTAAANAPASTAAAEGDDEADDFGDFTASPQPTAAVESQEGDDFGDFAASPQPTAAVESQEGDDFGDFAASPPPVARTSDVADDSAADAGGAAEEDFGDDFAEFESAPTDKPSTEQEATAAPGDEIVEVTSDNGGFGFGADVDFGLPVPAPGAIKASGASAAGLDLLDMLDADPTPAVSGAQGATGAAPTDLFAPSFEPAFGGSDAPASSSAAEAEAAEAFDADFGDFTDAAAFPGEEAPVAAGDAHAEQDPFATPKAPTTSAKSAASSASAAPVSTDELADAAWTLYSAACTSRDQHHQLLNALQCAQQVSCLVSLKELSHRKLVAMQEDDLEEAIEVRERIREVTGKLRGEAAERRWMRYSREVRELGGESITAVSPTGVLEDLSRMLDALDECCGGGARGGSRGQNGSALCAALREELADLTQNCPTKPAAGPDTDGPQEFADYLTCVLQLRHRVVMSLLLRTPEAKGGYASLPQQRWSQVLIEVKLLLEEALRRINDLEKLAGSSAGSVALSKRGSSGGGAVGAGAGGNGPSAPNSTAAGVTGEALCTSIKRSDAMLSFVRGMEEVVHVACVFVASHRDAGMDSEGEGGDAEEGGSADSVLVQDVLALCHSYYSSAARVGLVLPVSIMDDASAVAAAAVEDARYMAVKDETMELIEQLRHGAAAPEFVSQGAEGGEGAAEEAKEAQFYREVLLQPGGGSGSRKWANQRNTLVCQMTLRPVSSVAAVVASLQRARIAEHWTAVEKQANAAAKAKAKGKGKDKGAKKAIAAAVTAAPSGTEKDDRRGLDSYSSSNCTAVVVNGATVLKGVHRFWARNCQQQQ